MNNNEQKSFNTSDVVITFTQEELEMMREMLLRVVFIASVPEQLWRKIMDE